jgi:hypothetical protein
MLTCLVLYLIPRTSVLGAALMMGLLGGAMATQIRAGSSLFGHILFSVYLGLFLWGGLRLRDPRLRALFPFAREPSHDARRNEAWRSRSKPRFAIRSCAHLPSSRLTITAALAMVMASPPLSAGISSPPFTALTVTVP